ncbi:hypothetical protein [Pseudomonas sp. 7-41]|uniref:hypothetical protein n=1 Tax=Pseudomonas sp. 7-41 TaxID=2898483 RepID=UPI001E3A8377|nr:hypothetical protein [Pseudomonas sp. 7-41]UHG95285.1 hypothetical protein LQ249_16375 [Pseudomonas sp. 7-41]
MFTFELLTPGSEVVIADNETSRELTSQIGYLKKHFFDANTALNLVYERRAYESSKFDKDTWEIERQRRSELFSEVLQEFGNLQEFTRLGDNDIYDDIQLEATIRFSRENTDKGVLPEKLERNKLKIFAHAYLQALDSVGKFLKAITENASAPPEVGVLRQQFLDLFPDLQGVRDTIQHLEDRTRGLGRPYKGKKPPLDYQDPKKYVHAPGAKVLMFDCFMGNLFGCTKADGHYGEVDISPESMHELQKIIQDIIYAFEWKGMKQFEP